MGRRKRMLEELDEDIREHIDRETQDNIDRGLPPEEARYAAMRKFGNVTRVKEETREVWSVVWLEELWQDIRYGLRMLRKSPGFTAVAVLTLALGIGANTAIFSLIDAMMLRMLPVRNPQQLMLVQRDVGPDRSANTFTNPLWEALRSQQDVFSTAFAWSSTHFDLAQGGAVRYVEGMFVSGEYFYAVGIPPAAGRLISSTDDVRGCAGLAVLSYGFWQKHYGGSESAMGSTLSLNRQPFLVIGVVAPGFYGMEVGKNFDVAVPICSSALFDGKRSRLDARSTWWLSVAGRLKPDLTEQQATTRLRVFSPGIFQSAVPQDWDSSDQQRFLRTALVASPAATGISYLRRDFAQPLHILMALVALVLLIACANIASLLLARAGTRSREIAVRRALGASRSRLIRQLLAESLLLSLLGAAAGLLFAHWASSLLVGHLSTRVNQVFVDLSLKGSVLGFTAAVAILTAVLTGLLPALRSTSVPPVAAMKGSQIADEGWRPQFRTGKWIVAAQVAVSLLLLVSGGLLLRSLHKLLRLDIGFDRNNVLIVSADLRSLQIPPEQRLPIYEAIATRLRAVPGVTAVSRSFTTPLSGYAWNDFVISDAPNAPTGDAAVAWFNAITPGYFSVLRTPLLAGRDLTEADTRNGPPVAVVTQAMARQFYPSLNALGRHFRVKQDPGKPEPVIEVVGIVKDSKYESMREEPQPVVFLPAAQAELALAGNAFELRTAVPPSEAVASVQDAIGTVNRAIPLTFHTLAAQVDDNLVQARLLATLSGFFAALAVLLAMIGLYGVLNYLVTHRQTEFGIRMALGARHGSILWLVIQDTLAILGAGIATGLVISFAAVTMLRSMLFGMVARDTFMIASAVCLLSAVALLAGYLPARRAMKLDPMVALRYE